MAEAHQAVAFQFAVTDQGIHVHLFGRCAKINDYIIIIIIHARELYYAHAYNHIRGGGDSN